MISKKLLLATVAVATLGLSATSADAKERLTVYEINTFVNRLANAVNNPDPMIGRTFLAQNLNEGARLSNTIVHNWAHENGVYPAWYGSNTSSYYRYPYAYDYYRPTSVQSLGKTEIIAQFENKKHMIPRYSQTIDIMNTRMPADAHSAVVDVQMKEYGISYHYAQSPYQPYYAQKVLHSVSNCQLHLEKDRNDVRLDRISCNSSLGPVL